MFRMRACTPWVITVLFSLAVICPAAQTSSSASVQPSHKEIETIGSTPETRFGNLVTFCMDKDDSLLACDAQASHIRKIDLSGKTLAEWRLDFAPYAICADVEGAVYIAGEGIVASLGEAGKVLKRIQSDGSNFPAGRPSGIAMTRKDVFLAVGSGWSLRSRSSIVRFSRDLTEPTTIAQDLRGCCQRLDLIAKDDVLYVAENTRYRVLKCDRDGKVLAAWGSQDRTNIEGFGSCCNPMNLCVGPKAELYTAESGLARIKRYTPDGKFLGLVGYVGTDRFERAGRQAASCSNITVAVNKDGSRVYVLDFKNNLIRVMAKAGPTPGGKPTGQ